MHFNKGIVRIMFTLDRCIQFRNRASTSFIELSIVKDQYYIGSLTETFTRSMEILKLGSLIDSQTMKHEKCTGDEIVSIETQNRNCDKVLLPDFEFHVESIRFL